MPDYQVTPTPVRVLVVDDEVDYATALGARLRRRGFDADIAFSGADAIVRVSARPPDVVLLDLKMPGMDGLATLRALHRVAPRVRIIVLTGHGTVASGIEGMQIGADDFLLKPVDIDVLCVAIAATAADGRREAGSAPVEGSAT
jgi:two-component system response regulator RegA